MGVEMDGNADFLLQRGDQLVCGVRFAEAGHVLDGEDVGTHALHFLCLIDVVFQRVFVAFRVSDVSSITDRRFAKHFTMIAGGFHGHLHVRQVI